MTTHFKAKAGFEAARELQVRQLLAAIPADAPLVVAGDFNDVPGSPAYRLMTERLGSAYAVRGESGAVEEPPWTTWKVRAAGEARRTDEGLPTISVDS